MKPSLLLQVVWVWMSGALAARRGASSLPNFSLRPPLLDRLNYKTTYACEGKELKVSCDSGGVIRLIRANYGRFSISICNDQGTLDWSVNCMSFRSFLIMQDRCSQKPSCSIHVSSSIFGDPCVGTLKYLEVQYHCVSGSSAFTTRRPPPPLNPFLHPPSNGTADIGVHQANSTVQNSASVTPLPTTTPPSGSKAGQKTVTSTVTTTTTTLASNEVDVIVSWTTTAEPAPPPLNFIPSVTDNEHEISVQTIPPNGASELDQYQVHPDSYCPPVIARGLMWNWTRNGEVLVQKCPGGSTGLARWECGDNPVRWFPSSPDLRDCKSVWVENLRERMHEGDSVISIASELSQMTLNKQLFSKDLYHVTDLIEQTLARAVNGMESFLDMWRRYQVLRELLQSVVETVSKLLDKSQQDAWQDLTLLERKEIASALLDGLEESALLLAETSNQAGTFNLVKDNVLLSVHVMEALSMSTLRYPLLSDFSTNEETAWIRMEDSLVLPAQALMDYSKHGLTKIVFVVYNGMGDLLAPETGYESQSGFHAPGEDESRNISQIVNSRVISASIGRQGVVDLAQPVVVTLKHLQEENVTNPKCVYWDFNRRQWSGDGCWVRMYNRSHTVCACDHLTNFAVLMDIQPTFATPNRKILRLATGVGYVIATVCFLLAFLVLQIQRNLSGDQVTIHKNLAICLLLAELVFAGGVDQTHLVVFCSVVAGVLHYLFLAAFIWLFLESFHIYVRMVDVVEGERSKGRWYYALAYGVPVLIVCVSATVDPSSYGTKHYCWLRADNYFIFSFVGPAVGILFGAAVFLCIATCILCHHSGLNSAVKGKEEARLLTLKLCIRWVLILLVLFTLTWTTALVYVTDDTPLLAYCFTILNSLQGLYFLAFCSFGNGKVTDGCEQVLGTFLACWQKKPPGQEPNNGSAPVPGQLSVPPQSWSLPSEKSFNSLSFTAPAPQSTTVPPQSAVDPLTTQPPISTSPVVGWRCSPHGDHIPSALPVGSVNESWREHPNTHNQLSGTKSNKTSSSGRSRSSQASESCGPFSDHIYESIDEDSLSPTGDNQGVQGVPPVENYYGDQSDMSQHSSSSYGYDQRPLLVTLPARTVPLYEATSHKSPDSPVVFRIRADPYGSFKSSTRIYDASALVPGDLPSPSELSQWGPTLPDLLRCPNDNAVVMAILDGERVVSRIRPEFATSPRGLPSATTPTQSQQLPPQVHYKLSTYC